jgi:putative NADH-flavin reductase
MKICVLGGTGRTGRQFCSLALAKGHELNLLVRHPDKPVEMARPVTIVKGDSTDSTAILRAVSGCDAVVSTLGHTKGSPANLFVISIGHVIEAMRKEGVRRLVVLSSAGIFEPGENPRTAWKMMAGMARLFQGATVRDHHAAAQLVTSSGLDWTLVRAVGLTNGPRTADYRAGALDSRMGLTISRADAAAFLLQCLSDNSRFQSAPALGH